MTRSRTIRCLLAAALIAWLATGVYFVDSDERGVVRRFGRADDTLVEPGVNFDLPWPLSTVDRVRPDENRQVSVGLAAPEETVMVLTSEERRSEFFTGDQNLIHIQATCQYRVKDPAAYVLGIAQAERLLSDTLEAALAAEIAASGVDFVLTDGRAAIQQNVMNRVQQMADRYALGVAVSSVDLSSVRPPLLVQPDFQDAVNARNDRERYIHDARSQRVELLALASGERQRLLDEAETAKTQATQKAQGDAKYFTQIIAEFDKVTDPDRRQLVREMTRYRLWYESISRILPRLKSRLFVDPGQKVDVIIPREE